MSLYIILHSPVICATLDGKTIPRHSPASKRRVPDDHTWPVVTMATISWPWYPIRSWSLWLTQARVVKRIIFIQRSRYSPPSCNHSTSLDLSPARFDDMCQLFLALFTTKTTSVASQACHNTVLRAVSFSFSSTLRRIKSYKHSTLALMLSTL